MERKVIRPVLAAVTFVAAALLCVPALADDYGTHPDIRAIRHDLPIILQRSRGAIVVDDVVVDGNEAIARWHNSDRSDHATLVRKFDHWWILPIAPHDGYKLWTTTASSDAAAEDSYSDFALRAPTHDESWMVAGGNSYLFFYATVRSTKPIHVLTGTTLDVWFPFALPSEKKYSLTIGYTDEPIGPIDGTLKDNTLHFVLPAFSVQPGAHLMGEIDGDPPGL